MENVLKVRTQTIYEHDAREEEAYLFYGSCDHKILKVKKTIFFKSQYNSLKFCTLVTWFIWKYEEASIKT